MNAAEELKTPTNLDQHITLASSTHSLFLDHDSFPKTSLKLNAFKLTTLVQATRFILSMLNQPGVAAIVLGQDECQLCYTTRVYLKLKTIMLSFAWMMIRSRQTYAVMSKVRSQ